MVITKIVVGTVAVTVLAGTGIEGLRGSSAPKSQADPVALTRTPAVITAPIYAPIAAVPAWVEWRANPALRLGIGRARHHGHRPNHRAPAAHNLLLVASASAPHTGPQHGAAQAAPSKRAASDHTPKPTPVSYHPSSHTVTTVRKTRSSNGSSTTTRTTSTRTRSKNGTSRTSSSTHSTTTTPGTHPTPKPVSTPKPTSTTPTSTTPTAKTPATTAPTNAPVATGTTAAPTASPSSSSGIHLHSGSPGYGGGYHPGSGYHSGGGYHPGGSYPWGGGYQHHSGYQGFGH